MDEDNEYLEEDFSENSSNESSYQNSGSKSFRTSFNRRNSSNNDRVHNEIANRRLKNNSNNRSNSNSRVGAVDSSQMQNNRNNESNSSQELNSNNNNNKILNSKFNINDENENIKGEGKITIPKKLKFKIYLFLGIAVLFVVAFIFLVALISALFSSDGDVIEVDSDDYVFEDIEVYKACHVFNVYYLDNLCVQDVNFSDLIVSAVKSEIFKMSFPLSYSNYTEDDIGTEIAFDFTTNPVSFRYYKKNEQYEKVDISKKVIDNSFYVNDEFIKAFSLIVKTNIANSFSTYVRNNQNISNENKIKYIDIKNAFILSSNSPSCGFQMVKGRNQNFYSSYSKELDSLDFYNSIYNNVVEVSPSTDYSAPITYDFIALKGGNSISGYIVSDKGLVISHDWLYDNFPQLFSDELDENGKNKLLATTSIYNSSDSKNFNYTGYKVSLIGAYYLATEQGKKYTEILDYFLK